jgi:hypothetical protein
VYVEGDGLRPGSAYAFDEGAQRVRPDGTFSVRVPGDRPVTLFATHMLLRAAAEGGRVTVTEPRGGVVLRMSSAPQAVFRPDPVPVPSASGYPGPDDLLRILIYRGPTTDLPEATVKAKVVDGVARFGGYEPGTWTLFLDAHGRAPVLLPFVALGDGATDLGVVAFPEGGSVRVDVLVREGQAPPPLSLLARSKLGPEHWRQTHSFGERAVVLRGLGKARYQVTVESNARDRKYLEKLVDCDGASETVLTVDLR